MPMNGSGCLEYCVEKDPETASLKGQGCDWLTISFMGIGMETDTTDILYHFSSKSSFS